MTQNIAVVVKCVNEIVVMKFKRTHTTPVWWVVLSPEYDCNHGSYEEPPDYGRDCIYVRALNAHRAKVLAIRAWRRNRSKMTFRRWPYIVNYNDENPMAVLTVYRCLLIGDMEDGRVL